MNPRIALSLLAVGLIAVTTKPPGGARYFLQAVPPNPEPIRLLGRSHLSLITDLVWIRAIGVAINLKVPADGASLLIWCGLVTDLDPTFIYPYIFGGLLAPMSSHLGNHNVAESSALFRRGMANIPTDYRLPLYLSFNQLHLDHDVHGAAETLRQGARIPGAPAFMGQLASRLMAQSDDFEGAQAIAGEMEERSSDPEIRQVFARRRLEIERDRLLTTLQAAVDAYRASRGKPPQSLMQLLSEGLLTELPPDPVDGGEFELGPDGTVIAPSGARLKAFSQDEVR